MTTARLYLFGPIPNPAEWVMATDAPPGFLRLCSLSIAPRNTVNATGTELVPANGLPAQVERLLRAFQRLDKGGRDEVLHHAEQLAGAS